MIAQQLLGLVQELALVLRPSRFISPPQLPQKLCPCRLTHCFIHSGHGNPTSGATYPLTALSTPSRVTKLLAQFARRSSRNCGLTCCQTVISFEQRLESFDGRTMDIQAPPEGKVVNRWRT